MGNNATSIQHPEEAGSRAVSRPLWLAICETVVGRRRKATEGLAMIAAARLSARAQPQAEPHSPEAGIG